MKNQDPHFLVDRRGEICSLKGEWKHCGEAPTVTLSAFYVIASRPALGVSEDTYHIPRTVPLTEIAEIRSVTAF